MRRILLRTVSILMLSLMFPLLLAPAAGSQALAAGAEGRVVAAAELATVTGGCRKNCGGGSNPERRLIGAEWRFVSQVDGQAQQLSYGIVQEYSNVYGIRPINYRFTASDSCRHVFTSGGAGIAAGLNVSIGTTYHCATSLSLDGTIPVGYRVKIYRGEMRLISTITVAEHLVYSDGSTEASGKTDTGRRERTWYRFTPVSTLGN